MSIGTVSRVINDSGYASRGVRLRVQQAVSRLGYEPDLAARRLRSGRSDTIGYLLNHIANPFAQTRVPTVMLDRETGQACDSVIQDHFSGMRQVMDYLLSQGHRRIALFTLGAGARAGREKLHGYRSALEHAGLDFDDRLVFLARSILDSSRAPMRRMLQLDEPPTAIVALGTQLLSGAIHVIRGAGRQGDGVVTTA